MKIFEQLQKKKLQETIHISNVSVTQYLNEICIPGISSFVLTTETEIENIIMPFKYKKKCDISTYPIEPLKVIKPIVSHILAKVINNSLNSGAFLQILKTWYDNFKPRNKKC